MNDFLTFRRKVTPVIIQILYWILTLAAIVAGVVMMLSSEEGEAKAIGLGVLLIGPLVLRVYAEMLMVVFRINETLTEIKNLKSRS